MGDFVQRELQDNVHAGSWGTGSRGRGSNRGKGGAGRSLGTSRRKQGLGFQT